MKSKLNYLTSVSLKRKIKTKWFVLANILLAIGIIGIINVDHIISFFGGDFNEKEQIYVIDNTNKAYDIFENQIKTIQTSLNDEQDYEIHKYQKNIEEAKKLAKDDDKNTIIIFNDDEKDVLQVEIISNSYIDTFDYQFLSSALNATKSTLALEKTNISSEQLAMIQNPVSIKRTILDENKKSEDENMEMIMTMVFPVIILPFFMLTIFLVQMIGAEVNDEKSTRGMEIIISNVSPKTHFFSKVLAGNIFVLLQGLLLLVFSGIGLFIRNLFKSSKTSELTTYIGDIINPILNSDLGRQLIYIIPLALILMILTFLAYSLLAGILASITTNTEDFQQLQTPIMVILLIGYFLATMAGMFEGSIFIKIISYIPLISAILSPSLLVLGQIGIFDVIISIIFLLGLIYLLIKYGLRIYKVGILNYTSKDLWKKMFKALK